MKMPGALGFLFTKKNTVETFLSLYLDVHTAAASFWQIGGKTGVHTLASAHLPVKNDSWEDRIDAVDRLLGALEEKTNISEVTTTILGLPPAFLTPTGEIQKHVRKEVKDLAEELELILEGFVSLHQAIIFKLKKDEGIPPSVILLGVNTKTVAISLYKIGSLVDVRDIEEHEDVAVDVEHGLKSFTEMEVLPARILLYGADEHILANAKAKLMRHPWTTKANFLHFPKIELVTFDFIVDAVSLAGASEMKMEMKEDTDESPVLVETSKEESEEEIPEKEDEVAEEVEEAREEIEEDYSTKTDASFSDDNVEIVDAETLGFIKNTDILDKPQVTAKFVEKFRGIRLPVLHIKKINIKGFVPVVIAILVFAVLTWLFFWTVPHVTVTVLEIPKSVEKKETVIIDLSATTVDAEKKIIPGREREQQASGEKTTSVVGKKSVGDPAKGMVTIYNKSLSSLSFKKGTTLTTGSLKFTLDADVTAASASESIGSITFGKVDAAVTAAAIGVQSNITSNSEFSIANTSTSVAIARNDAALTGGTSREVVVVTRSDYDAFVKAISEELTLKAKGDLASSVTGGEQLVDGTIKTTVKEKVFQQELDQESTSLSGKVTVSVTGIAYTQDDVRALFLSSLESELPTGYTVDNENLTVTVTNAKVAKDGKITATIVMKATALPTIDVTTLSVELAGKNISDASEFLKAIPGVAGVEVKFRLSPTNNRLPINKKNISVNVAVSE